MNIKDITTFSYSDIIFSFCLNEDTTCDFTTATHFIIYVHTGQMSINESDRSVVVRKGECVFLKKGTKVTFSKYSVDEAPFQGITMVFKHSMLKSLYEELNPNTIPKGVAYWESSIIKLEKSLDIDSLFCSLTPYLNSVDKPNKELMDLKLKQALCTLLSLDKRFYPTLFDFSSDYKINILWFLNQNYMCNLTVKEMAIGTGRSLASFKRDFKQVSSLTPQKWLMKKRLDEAYAKIKNRGVDIAQVGFEVGFKNRAHFTTAFKNRFGVPPSEINK